MEKLRPRFNSQAVVDGLLWCLSILVAGLLRFDFELGAIDPAAFALLGLMVATINYLLGYWTGLYRWGYKLGSLSDGIALGIQTLAIFFTVGGAVGLVGNLIGVPRSTVFIAAPLFFAFSGATRILRRNPGFLSVAKAGSRRALIYGAGDMAEILVSQLLKDVEPAYHPVGLIDDDPAKANRRILGVRCLGSGATLRESAKRTAATAVIVAVPRADSDLLQSIHADAQSEGLEVLVLPSFVEILAASDGEMSLRDLTIEDLIGRRAVEIDPDHIRHAIRGKVVLVTGAGGSIGLEICRQVSRLEPSELIFLDRDESGLQLAQLAVEGNGLLESSSVVLADIREKEVLEEVFGQKRPELVFHAAALKHLPVLERHPAEAWKTNVLGTANLLEVAHKFGVASFVNISTDKAADPSSVLGRSKLIAEEMTAWYATTNGANFVSVRFGNVLGSRGSLVPTISELIRQGGPVTLTHPEVTRFFMTASEACQLVLQASALAKPGDVFVLDMGRPARILDIARKMIQLSGKSVEIVFTGLRSGEKLHERLFSDGATLLPTSHPLVSRVPSAVKDPKTLDMTEFLRESSPSRSEDSL
jgi:dTDP-glucose 4,6-dehydratase